MHFHLTEPGEIAVITGLLVCFTIIVFVLTMFGDKLFPTALHRKPTPKSQPTPMTGPLAGYVNIGGGNWLKTWGYPGQDVYAVKDGVFVKVGVLDKDCMVALDPAITPVEKPILPSPTTAASAPAGSGTGLA